MPNKTENMYLGRSMKKTPQRRRGLTWFYRKLIIDVEMEWERRLEDRICEQRQAEVGLREEQVAQFMGGLVGVAQTASDNTNKQQKRSQIKPQRA